MSETSRSQKAPLHIKRHALALAVAWTIVVGASLTWNCLSEHDANLELARTHARDSFNNDLIYRRWNAIHGGVYVLITEDTPPNPHLSHIEKRDIVTSGGQRLTLINPAYMTRQVHELRGGQDGTRGHITSLNPIRAANAPDPWEEKALKAFQTGEQEISSVEPLGGKSYLRLMRPMVTEKGCLNCHATQGYKEGELRGGISVSVPMSPYLATGRAYALDLSLGHGFMWLMGLGCIGWGTVSIQRRVRERDLAEAARERHNTFMQTVIDGSPESLMVINRDKTIALANQTARGTAGVEDPVAACLKCHVISHASAGPCESKDYACSMEQVLKTKAPVTVEHIHYDTEGCPFSVEIIAAPIFDEEGEVIQMILSCRDITDRKRSEDLLTSTKAFLDTVVDMSPFAMWVADPNGTIIRTNHSLRETLNLTDEQLLGKYNVLADANLERQGRMSLVKRVFEKHEPVRFSIPWTGAATGDADFEGARDLYIDVSLFPILNDEGELVNVVCQWVDITDQKRAEQDRLGHLQFLENMEWIDRVIVEAADLEQMMKSVLDVVLSIFSCDRAYLLYPCDPNAETWRVPMERTRSEYPGAFDADAEFPMTPRMAEDFRKLLAENGPLPVQFKPGEADWDPEDKYFARSNLVMAIHPKTGKAWSIGITQCSHTRSWTTAEQRLLQEIGYRLTGALNAILYSRDLKKSEEKLRLFVESFQGIAYQAEIESWQPLLFEGTIEKITGYAPGDFLTGATSWPKIIHPEDTSHAHAQMDKLLSDIDYVANIEYRILQKTGGIRWVREVARLVTIEGRSVIQGTVVDITDRKRAEEALEKRLVALTQPLEDTSGITFDDLFNLSDIQRIQNEFADATCVASIITDTNGTPITAPSNFCRLCNDIIRKTDKGCTNCFKSDAALGRFNPDGPIVQPCMSGGLWDAGAAIMIGGKHIANWLIGQVRDDTQTEEEMRTYAREIGADEEAVIEAFREVPAMSREQFGQVAQALFTLANQLSTSAYQNVQQARFITECKRAEEALQESEVRFRELFDNMSSGVAVYRAIDDGENFVLVDFNQAGTRIENIPKEKSIGRRVTEVFPGVETFGLMDILRRVWQTGKPEQFPMGYYKDGRVSGWRENSVYRLPSGEVVAVYDDVTDRRQAEEALRESEAKYRTFFDNSVDAMLVIENREFVDCNKAATAMLRYDSKDQVIHRSPAELSPEVQPDGRTSEDKAIEMMSITTDRGSHSFEWAHKRKDGSVLPVEVSLTAIRERNRTMLHTVWRDISARKRAEEALIQAQESLLAQERHGREMVENELAKVREKLVTQTRLATIGQVAASIAHELRNPLGAVRNAAYYLKRHVPTDNPKLPEYLGIIDQEVGTADIVIRNMMEMARSKEPLKKSVDLGSLVQGVVSSIHPPETIQCSLSLDPDPFVTHADPVQLSQVLNNLFDNAMQVMADTGEIRLEAKRNAEYDVITIQDSGPGVADEVRKQVFEPLYTTKAKGTGLGLTICRQIIDRHGGTIELVDHAGPGALFRIRLLRQSTQAPLNDV